MWVHKGEDEESAGPVATDALEVRLISVIPVRPPVLVSASISTHYKRQSFGADHLWVT